MAVSLSRTVTETLPRTLNELQRRIEDRMLRIPTRLNAYGYDAWGFHPDVTRRALLVSGLLYYYWFRAETEGIERIPPGRVLLISNHAGQVALDAAMIGCATFFEAEPPRIIRGMGEYWLPTVPWVSELMVRTGSVVGTRKNAIDLLRNDECVIAFPEPVARSVFRTLFRLGLYHTPSGAMDFLKYPCTIDGRAFQRATGFKPLFTLEDIFASVRH